MAPYVFWFDIQVKHLTMLFMRVARGGIGGPPLPYKNFKNSPL